MPTPDKMTRAVNGAHSTLGVTAIAFDAPSIALTPGEYITDGTYHYPVTSCTKSSIGIGTAIGQTTAGLKATLADNAVLTREDCYAPIDFDSLCAMLGKSDLADDNGQLVTIYRAAWAARAYGENIVGNIKARSQTKTYSMGAAGSKLYLRELHVESVESVFIDDVEIDSDTYTLNTDEGYLLYDGYFPVGVDHIDVTYTPGWTYVHPQLINLYAQQTSLFLQAMGGDNINVLSSVSTQGARERTFRSPMDIQKYLDSLWRGFAKVNVNDT